MKRLFIIILTIAIVAPAMAQKSRPAKQGRPTNEMTISGMSSKNNAQKDLQNRQSMLSQQIAAVSGEISGSKKSAAKKMSKQLEALTADLAVVNRLLATFPQQQDNTASIQAEDAIFQRQLDSVAAIRIAATDPYAGKISNDPVLEKMYREYLAQNGTIPFIELNSDGQVDVQAAAGGERVFRIMLAISKTALPASSFSSMSDVLEQRLPSGGRVYYQGSYTDKYEAEQACRAILSKRHFRDAFVVAMEGNRRVAM